MNLIFNLWLKIEQSGPRTLCSTFGPTWGTATVTVRLANPIRVPGRGWYLHFDERTVLDDKTLAWKEKHKHLTAI